MLKDYLMQQLVPSIEVFIMFTLLSVITFANLIISYMHNYTLSHVSFENNYLMP